MTLEEIKRTQSIVGTVPDGFWGPKSISATQRYLKSWMPNPHPFPKQSRVEEFYGPPGKPPTKAIQIPFRIYYEGSAVRTLRPHVKCADSLLRVFERLRDMMTDDELKEAGVTTYDGLFNPRRMRGGTSWSMHAWAIAIDLDATRNGNLTHWPTKAKMPIEVMQCFAMEGWMAAGGFWGRDAMHFQATAP